MRSVPFVFEEWCGWSESNRQRGNPQRILSPPRMPISPQPHRVYTRRTQNSTAQKQEDTAATGAFTPLTNGRVSSERTAPLDALVPMLEGSAEIIDKINRK